MSIPAIEFAHATQLKSTVNHLKTGQTLVYDYSKFWNHDLAYFYKSFHVKSYNEFNKLSAEERYSRIANNLNAEYEIATMSPGLATYGYGGDSIRAFGQFAGEAIGAAKDIFRMAGSELYKPLSNFLIDESIKRTQDYVDTTIAQTVQDGFRNSPGAPPDFQFY